jgi:hypothetical protein
MQFTPFLTLLAEIEDPRRAERKLINSVKITKLYSLRNVPVNVLHQVGSNFDGSLLGASDVRSRYCSPIGFVFVMTTHCRQRNEARPL